MDLFFKFAVAGIEQKGGAIVCAAFFIVFIFGIVHKYYLD